MRKLALLVFLMTNLGGVAMAAPMNTFAGGFAMREAAAPREAPQTFQRDAPQMSQRTMPRIPPRGVPQPTLRERPRLAEAQRAELRRRGVTLMCDDAGDVELYVDAFAHLPQLDGSNKDLPIALTNADTADADTIKKALMRGFEQALNQESARQGRSVDALLAHGAKLGNRDEYNQVWLYTFNLDAELHIVREAYLLRTQPTKA
jgi:hypothetical protein